VEQQLQLVDAGYIIEAQELELYKSHILESTPNNSDDPIQLHPKLAEYADLLKNEPVNLHNVTKNTEAIRSAIVNSAVRGISQKLCRHCKMPLKRVKYAYKKLVIYVTKKEMELLKNDKDSQQDLDAVKPTNKILFADECRNYLKEIFKFEKSFLMLLFPVLKNTSGQGYNIFFMDVLPVVPPIVRPANILRGSLLEHPQTKTYYNVLSTNNQLRYILAFAKTKSDESDPIFDEVILKEAKTIFNLSRGETPYEKIYYKWQELQTCVDQTLDIKMTNSNRSEDGFGLKQILEKKEGEFCAFFFGVKIGLLIIFSPYLTI
jgi:DNA-directed RNA polymerase I subunit RPA1